jgi:hypothetical protein
LRRQSVTFFRPTFVDFALWLAAVLLFLLIVLVEFHVGVEQILSTRLL